MSALGRAERARWRAALASAAARAARRARPVCAVLVAPVPARDPLPLFAAGGTAPRFFFESPHSGVTLSGVGCAAEIASRGPAALADAARALSALFDDAVVASADAPAWGGPLLVGGFAFDPEVEPSDRWRGFPPGRLWLPEVAIARRGERAFASAALRVAPHEDVARALAVALERVARALRATRAAALPALSPAGEEAPDLRTGADPTPDGYRHAVGEALRAIEAGALEKVAVARSCTLARGRAYAAERLVAALRAGARASFRFAAGWGDAVFLGASPERLAALDGGAVRSDPLAGSAPRGRSSGEDAAIGRALRESKKDQAEHAIVVRAVRAALEPLCASLDVPESPRLLRLESVQHLHTPVRGTLRAGAGACLLDVAARLHPTPAVGGAPRDAALAWLRAHERLDRGWYAGPIGWTGPSGEGELAIALRSALVRGGEATLFAGAGIVAGSEPDAELAETRLKLRAALAAFQEG